jgi:hypothetical protein
MSGQLHAPAALPSEKQEDGSYLNCETDFVTRFRTKPRKDINNK